MLNIIFLAEQELLRLQQEYRIMEGDRKAYSEESQNIIRKQRAAITTLQAENEELMKDNHLAGSQQNENKVNDLSNCKFSLHTIMILSNIMACILNESSYYCIQYISTFYLYFDTI